MARSRFARTRVRARLIAAFWQSALLHLLYRATRPPSARAAASIALTAVLFGVSGGGMHVWLTGGDWPWVIQQGLFSMPLMVSIPLINPGDTFVATVPERERWRTFHQFTVCWVALASLYSVVMGAPGWLPIGAAVNAIAARVIAGWIERRRDGRAGRR